VNDLSPLAGMTNLLEVGIEKNAIVRIPPSLEKVVIRQ